MTAREPLADIAAEAPSCRSSRSTPRTWSTRPSCCATTSSAAAPKPAGTSSRWTGCARSPALTGADWGWYTTLSDNLAKLAAFAQDALAEPDRAAVTGRVQAIQAAIDEPSKSLRWKARARIGRHAPWYELPEEVAGTRNG